MLVDRRKLRLKLTMTPVASVVAAKVASEELGLIEPLMESLEHDLLPRDDRAPDGVRRAAAPVRRRGRARATRVGARGGAGGAMSRRRYRATVTIDAPPEEVWRTVLDPDRLGDWVTIHRKVNQADDGAAAQGIQDAADALPARRALQGPLDADRARASRAWRPGRGAVPAQSYARTTYRLTAVDKRATRFDYENEFHAPGGSSARQPPARSSAARPSVRRSGRCSGSSSCSKAESSGAPSAIAIGWRAWPPPASSPTAAWARSSSPTRR